ncbi:Peptidase S1 domain-containing protein [Aphelenchoides bicaudatus]|nr:Peptidase S1 domain-containing protein [Aphelenchoides bicaudatus]
MMRCGSTLFGVLFACFVFQQAQSILNGDKINWSRHSYLVKVFSRTKRDDVKSCTGALISNSLILTSRDCVLKDNSNEPMREFSTVLSISGSRHHEKAQLLEVNDSWALLEIRELSLIKLCPDDQPRHVLPINLKPTLNGSSIVNVPVDEIINSRCFLAGFNTTDESKKFLQVTTTLRLDVNLKLPYENDGYYRAQVIENSTACYDDVGAPLICSTTHHGIMLVGFFRNSGIPVSHREDSQNRLSRREKCALAREMYFDLITVDTRLIEFIEKHFIGAVVQTYQKCFLNERE